MQREELYKSQRTTIKKNKRGKDEHGSYQKRSSFRNVENWSLRVLLISKTKMYTYKVSGFL